MIPWPPTAIVNHLWQSTLFAGVVWLAAMTLRQNGARVRYWLWVAASVKFLVPFAWLVTLGAQFEWRAASVLAQPAAVFVMNELFAPPPLPLMVPTPGSQDTSVIPSLVGVVWLAGFLAVLAQWVSQWLPVGAALRAAAPLALDACVDTRGCRVLSSPSVLEPAVVGIWRPSLLVPERLIDRLTLPQLRALVAHERCHVRCHDNLFAALHMLVEALFWFHPLAWWIERRLIDEREKACDEAVLASGHGAVDYAHGILEVCRGSIASPLTCVAGIGGADLCRRIESILRNDVGQALSPRKRLLLTVAAAAIVAIPVAAGALAATQSERIPTSVGRAFEVVSIRVNTSGGPPAGGVVRGRTYSATNMPLRWVIAAAYGVRLEPERLVGGPAWIGGGGPPFTGDRFDIVATLPEKATPRDVPEMLRALLANRFKLVAHTETREIPAYALVPVHGDRRLGPQLRRSETDCEALEAAGATVPPAQPGERGMCDSEIGIPGGGIVGRGQRLTRLARMMSQFVGRPIVDQTGLTGAFDFELRFSEEATRVQGSVSDDGVSLFTALQEQLGLELQSTRSPIEVVVIDSVERPTPD